MQRAGIKNVGFDVEPTFRVQAVKVSSVYVRAGRVSALKRAVAIRDALAGFLNHDDAPSAHAATFKSKKVDMPHAPQRIEYLPRPGG